MLQRILSLMAEGKADSQEDLVRSLGVSASMVSQMLVQLVGQGYLREAEQCGSSCTGCSLATACGEHQALHVWTLTKKGQRAATRGH